MIAVDASALLAILLDEPEGPPMRDLLLRADEAFLSPVGYWEAATKLRSHHGDAGVVRLDRLLTELHITIFPASETSARLASGAEARFGKRTPARLNLGDCFAYALARQVDAPLLFKGADFPLTDVRSAFQA